MILVPYTNTMLPLNTKTIDVLDTNTISHGGVVIHRVKHQHNQWWCWCSNINSPLSSWCGVSMKNLKSSWCWCTPVVHYTTVYMHHPPLWYPSMVHCARAGASCRSALHRQESRLNRKCSISLLKKFSWRIGARLLYDDWIADVSRIIPNRIFCGFVLPKGVGHFT